MVGASEVEAAAACDEEDETRVNAMLGSIVGLNGEDFQQGCKLVGAGGQGGGKGGAWMADAACGAAMRWCEALEEA